MLAFLRTWKRPWFANSAVSRSCHLGIVFCCAFDALILFGALHSVLSKTITYGAAWGIFGYQITYVGIDDVPTAFVAYNLAISTMRRTLVPIVLHVKMMIYGPRETIDLHPRYQGQKKNQVPKIHQVKAFQALFNYSQ